MINIVKECPKILKFFTSSFTNTPFNFFLLPQKARKTKMSTEYRENKGKTKKRESLCLKVKILKLWYFLNFFFENLAHRSPYNITTNKKPKTYPIIKEI